MLRHHGLFLVAFTACGRALSGLDEAPDDTLPPGPAATEVQFDVRDPEELDDPDATDAGRTKPPTDASAPCTGDQNVPHANGFGGTYTSCSPLGTCSSDDARQAGSSYVRSQGRGGAGSLLTAADSRCSGHVFVYRYTEVENGTIVTKEPIVATWAVSGPARCHARLVPDGGSISDGGALCPTLADPEWN